jgi:retron-type reverse transcriptase
MSNQTTTNNNWRDELRNVGKRYFEIQEMIRMGFLKLKPEELEQLKQKYTELNKINKELNKLSKELEGLEDITPLIKEIRKNRIERVRAARAIRKAEKAQQEKVRKAEIAQRKKDTPYYLGDGVSAGLKFEGGDEAQLKEAGLPVIHNVRDLAELMKMPQSDILWLSYHRKAASLDHYSRFQIPKRKGGFRSIASPKPKTRKAQQWILENILSKIDCHEAAMAFRAGKSIADNANFHLNAEILIRIDLKDFFPSLKFGRVKGLFKSFGYNEGVASVLALMCTDALRFSAKLEGKQYFVALGERYLPQGACTSPAITNLICRKLDNRLSKLSNKLEWKYTRYADDMVFSSSNKDADLKHILGLSKKIIGEENFIIHPDKTMVMRGHQRQTVTGVVVNNDEIRISRRDMRNFRAFLHQYEQKGAAEMTKQLGKDATAYGKGYLAFVQMINPAQAEKFKAKYAWLNNG